MLPELLILKAIPVSREGGNGEDVTPFLCFTESKKNITSFQNL
jgi:hypothetical protein